MIGIGIAIECVMIAIMTLGIQRIQSNCHENPGMARDDDNNHEHVTIAITTSGVSRGIVTRIWDCPHPSVQIHVRYEDNMMTMCCLGCPSGHPADGTMYTMLTGQPDNIK